jgi:hypothetical protein
VEHGHLKNVSQFGGTQSFLKLFSIWWNTVILNFPQFGGAVISKLFSTWGNTGISKCCGTQSVLNFSQFGGARSFLKCFPIWWNTVILNFPQFGGAQSFLNYTQFGGAQSFLNYSQFGGAPSFLKCFPI